MKTENELIAVFMGAEFVRKPHVFYPDQFTETYIFKGHPGNWRVEKETKSHMTAPMLCYHTDWDWLMPVVEKIDSMGYTVTILRTRTIITLSCNVQSNIQSIHPGYSMIEITYSAVVEFIKWFNSYSPNKQ